MSRLLGVLTLLAAFALGGLLLPGYMTRPSGLRVPAGLLDPSLLDGLVPTRGASRDRSLPGKDRIRSRRGAVA